MLLLALMIMDISDPFSLDKSAVTVTLPLIFKRVLMPQVKTRLNTYDSNYGQFLSSGINNRLERPVFFQAFMSFSDCLEK